MSKKVIGVLSQYPEIQKLDLELTEMKKGFGESIRALLDEQDAQWKAKWDLIHSTIREAGLIPSDQDIAEANFSLSQKSDAIYLITENETTVELKNLIAELTDSVRSAAE